MNTSHPNPHGKLEERAADLSRIIDSSVLRLWETIESLEGLHPRNLDRFRVSLFGSSRILPENPVWAQVRELARRLSEAGCDVLTGGGAGLMQAANEGASKEEDCGPISGDLPLRLLGPRRPKEQEHRIYSHRTFFSRLHHFVRLSSAYVVLPGGLGTCLEAMMVWQLLQVRHIPPTSFLLFGSMWEGLLDWMREEMLANGLLAREDLAIPSLVVTVDDAVERILMDFKSYEKSDTH